MSAPAYREEQEGIMIQSNPEKRNHSINHTNGGITK